MLDTLSPYGEAIVEIHVIWPLRQIARHVGCNVEQVRRLRDDPRCMPNYRLGEAILELRDNLRYGVSKWGRMVLALKAIGFTRDQIAGMVGVTSQAIMYIENDPTVIPSHETATKLLEIYRRHGRT